MGAFIAGFKSAVTRRARDELQMTGIWQRNYYEHIIRSETEWAKIVDYIHTNPSRSAEDQLHPRLPSGLNGSNSPKNEMGSRRSRRGAGEDSKPSEYTLNPCAQARDGLRRRGNAQYLGAGEHDKSG